MYGSAEVVGLMMTKIIGYDGTKEWEVLRTACLLGEAMQYTNFLRDVLEDFVVHGRIYMPADRLKQFGLTTTHVEELCQWDMSSLARWQVFIQDQIACCRLLYQEANSWIALLHPDWRKAVRYASRLYESILTKIEKRAGNVFSANVRTTKFEKLKTLFTSWLQSPF
jgi:phytoene synthase